MQTSLVRTLLAAVMALLGFGTLGLSPPRALAPPVRRSLVLTSFASTKAAPARNPSVLSDGQLASPPWWEGSCDDKRAGSDPDSKPLGASWDGLTACGPGTNEGGPNSLVEFFSGAWGEYEWQCVELSMRWMYLAWGVPPYPADGNEIADNYAEYNPDGPKLEVVRNGTKDLPPQPGDVLELTDDDASGHTEVVTASSVNSLGDGTVTTMSENLNSPTDGWSTLAVKDWVVNGGFGTVVDWLHNPVWSLQEPVVSELSSAGVLTLRAGTLRSPLTEVASGVAQAEVVGGGGDDPAPIAVVLTTSGVVEASYELPGAPWWTLGTGATAISAASGEGPSGQPTIGWLTRNGEFYLQVGGLSKSPVLEATGAKSIGVGSASPSSEPIVGYVTASSKAYVRVGSAPFSEVAIGVKSLTLADGGADGAGALEGYVGVAGRAFVRSGLKGAFEEVGPSAARSVSEIALATAGPSATPLVAYLTTSGGAYADYGTSGFVHELSGARSVVVAAGQNEGAFPMLAVEQADGSWSAKEGSLSSAYSSEGAAAALDLGALVVS